MIESRSEPEPMSGCWIWTGTVKNNGYGVLYGVYSWREHGKRWQKYAHRLSHEMYTGPIPSGLEIDHLCRNTLCVNPAHLEAVTRRVNLLRGHTFAARNAAKRQCPRGHAYDTIRDRQRRCLACGRDQRRQYVARRSAMAGR